MGDLDVNDRPIDPVQPAGPSADAATGTVPAASAENPPAPQPGGEPGNGGSGGQVARSSFSRAATPLSPETFPLAPHAVRIHRSATVPTGAVITEDSPAAPFASLEAVQARLRPTPSTAHLPRWNDLIEITQNDDDGSIAFTGKSYDPSKKGEQSWSVLGTGAQSTFQVARRAKKLLKAGDEEGFNHLTAIWGAMNLNLAGLKVTVKGLENLDPNEIYLFAPTHTSSAEFSLLFLVLNGFNIGFLAKEEFRTNPVLNALMGQAMVESPRFFFIRREDAKSTRGVAGALAAFLADPNNEASVVLYPQGTRALGRTDETGKRMDGDLFAKGPLKKGIGQVAMATAALKRPVKVVPITINGLGVVQPKGFQPIQTNEEVEVVIGKPIDPTAYKGLHEKAAARQITGEVEKHFRAHYKAPLSDPKAKKTAVQTLPEQVPAVMVQPQSLELVPTKNEVPTWQAMRGQRVGWWLAKTVILQAVRRFLSGKPAELGAPKIVYHDRKPFPTTFAALCEAHRLAHAADYKRVGALIDSQLKIQSDTFGATWEVFLARLAAVRQPFADEVREYLDAYEAAGAHPSYEPVSKAAYALHQAIIASPLFADIGPDLRIFAFYTLEARDRFHDLSAGTNAEKDEKNKKKLEGELKKARGRYYRLLGRGIRYRILNEIDRRRGPKDTVVGMAALMQIHGQIHDLRSRAEQVELTAELLASGTSLRGRLTAVENKLADLNKKMGPLEVKRYHPMSHAAGVYSRLLHERDHLCALIDQFGAEADLEWLLNSLANSGEASDYHLIPQDPFVTLDTLLEQAPEVRKKRVARKQAEAGWEGAYWLGLSNWLPGEMGIYQATFRTEFEMNRLEEQMQAARYEDLVGLARTFGGVTRKMETKYDQALADYRSKFDAYLEMALDMTNPTGKTKEYNRKKGEIDLFFSWLRLHWTVADIYRAIGHPDAAKLQLFSVMFPDQVEFLNNRSSEEIEGLRPIFESLTLEQIVDLYSETWLAGNDPRKLDKIMGRWGLDATRRGVKTVHIHGAGILAGALGQSSGKQLFEKGLSLLKEDQVREFGVVPQMMAFSANHQGFSDYTFIVAFFASLGLGRPWVIYEAKNFDPFPILGNILRHGDGIGFERGRGGSNLLQARINTAVDQGVSPLGFDHGTRRMASTVNPLAADPLGAFIPREYIFGGSIGEMGEAARQAGIPLVPVFQGVPLNHDPDIPLSANGFVDYMNKFFMGPWAIHSGAPMGGEAVLALGDPIPAWTLPETVEEMERLGISVNGVFGGNGDVERRPLRWAMAAHTEVARFRASLKPLKASLGEPNGDGEGSDIDPKGAPSGQEQVSRGNGAGARSASRHSWFVAGMPGVTRFGVRSPVFRSAGLRVPLRAAGR